MTCSSTTTVHEAPLLDSALAAIEKLDSKDWRVVGARRTPAVCIRANISGNSDTFFPLERLQCVTATGLQNMMVFVVDIIKNDVIHFSSLQKLQALRGRKPRRRQGVMRKAKDLSKKQ
jgi:hypothetical protein